jgi:hypothetical protein
MAEAGYEKIWIGSHFLPLAINQTNITDIADNGYRDLIVFYLNKDFHKK